TSGEVNRGGNNWLEQLADHRQINFGGALVNHQSDHPAAYPYAWYAGAQTALTNGALDNLASQVSAGQVTLAYVGGEILDYGAHYGDIYSGALAGPALADFTDTIVRDTATELDTL